MCSDNYYFIIILYRVARYLIFADMPIFFNSFWPIADADTDIFPFVWKQHQAFAEIIS